MRWFYKGHRVLKIHRNIFYNAIVFICLSPTAISIICGIIYKGIQRYETSSLTSSVLFGISISLVILLLMIPMLKRMYNMQKLCQMVFSRELYGIKRKEGEVVDQFDNKLSYFPTIYYRKRKEKQVQVTFKLDGSKNHEKFLEMGDILGHIFAMETVEQERRLWYIVYTLEYVNPNRIYLSKQEIKYESGKIPLMHNLVWDTGKASHALVTGNTGGGKTFFLMYLIRSFLILGADIKILDPKRSDLSILTSILGEESVVYAPGGIIKTLREAVEEMDARYDIMNESKKFGATYKDYGMLPYVVLFDEFIAFIESLQDRTAIKKVNGYLTQLILKGRQAGCFLILATQRADTEYMKGPIRDNLGLRVSLGSLESAGYKMTFGDVDNKFEKFKEGHGYVYIGGTTSRVREFYAPHLGIGYNVYDDFREILRQETRMRRGSASSGSIPGLPAGSPSGLEKEGTDDERSESTPHY